MEYTLNHKPDASVATCRGEFTFTDNQRFRHLLNSWIEEKPTKVVLDLAEVTYIDSAALGMLLLLRERMGEEEIALVLSSPSDQVAEMFRLSRFSELFTIE